MGDSLDFPKSLLERLGYQKESLKGISHKYTDNFSRNRHTNTIRPFLSFVRIKQNWQISHLKYSTETVLDF